MKMIIDENLLSTIVMIKKNNEIHDFYVDLKMEEDYIDQIYLGKITNIIPSMKAMFVDIGLSENAYLDFNDLLIKENINNNYYNGKEIFVQVIKNPIDNKGAKVKEDLSIRGENIIFLPNNPNVFISKKIQKDEKACEYKKHFESIIKNNGVIIRTQAINFDINDLKKEYDFLLNQWKDIKKNKVKKLKNRLVFSGDNIYTSLLLDYGEKINKIITNSKDVLDEIKIKTNFKIKILEYKSEIDLLRYLPNFINSSVNLGNGINLSIESTEALVSIDVNSGKYISSNDKNGIYEVNYLALKEVAKQINCRDLSGIILIDLINLRSNKLKERLIFKFDELLKKYPIKYSVLGFTKTGLLEATKQYKYKSLKQQFNSKIQYIKGLNYNKTFYLLDIYNRIRNILNSSQSKLLKVICPDEIKEYLIENENFMKWQKNNLEELYFANGEEIKIYHLASKEKL